MIASDPPRRPEFRQDPEAGISRQPVRGGAGTHPEVAQVADDHQIVGRGDLAEPVAEPTVAFGMILAQMDVAGEVMRHVQKVPTVSAS